MHLESLPLFSLTTVLYPDEVLPLHVFEPKYKQMVEDCLANDAPFGVILNREGVLEDIGCTASITKVTAVGENGEKDIIVTGMERFRIREVFRNQLYLTADIDALLDHKAPLSASATERVIAQHIKLLELAGRTPSPVMYQERERLSFFIAHNAGLTIDQKQEVLELGGESDRITYLIAHLERFIPAVEEAESVRKKVRSNGHFKDFPPEI
jgi:ATP-dependent Lon protease